MALLFMDGFDAGDVALKWALSGTITAGGPGRFGSPKAMAITGSSASAIRTVTPAAKLIVGFAYQNVTGVASTSSMMRLLGDGGAQLHLLFGWSTATTFNVWRTSTGTLLASASVPEPMQSAGAWAYIEICATLNDTTGNVKVRVNETQVIDFTGDTRNLGTSTNIDAVQFARANTSILIDDVYIVDDTGTSHNTFLGDVRVQTLSPAAAGSSTQFQPNGAAYNWDNVDELPYSTGEFNSSGTAGYRDLYTMSDLLPATGSVLAVQNNLIARKTDSGSRSIKTVLKSGGTTVTGTPTALAVSDTTVSTVRPVDPATSAAWTPSAVNALEAGAEVV